MSSSPRRPRRERPRPTTPPGRPRRRRRAPPDPREAQRRRTRCRTDAARTAACTSAPTAAAGRRAAAARAPGSSSDRAGCGRAGPAGRASQLGSAGRRTTSVVGVPASSTPHSSNSSRTAAQTSPRRPRGRSRGTVSRRHPGPPIRPGRRACPGRTPSWALAGTRTPPHRRRRPAPASRSRRRGPRGGGGCRGAPSWARRSDARGGRGNSRSTGPSLAALRCVDDAGTSGSAGPPSGQRASLRPRSLDHEATGHGRSGPQTRGQHHDGRAAPDGLRGAGRRGRHDDAERARLPDTGTPPAAESGRPDVGLHP